MAQYIFKRYEKKFPISTEQMEEIIKIISTNTVADKYGESDICSIYCDTPDFRIIRASIQKPVYKEKLRLRSYGIPKNNDKCFLELKKKYKGVVYKRRIGASYEDSLSFLQYKFDNIELCQIKQEIDYFRKVNLSPTPSIDVFYRRKAFYDKKDSNVRITFDRDLFYRNYDLDLKNGIYGERIIPENRSIMEIKTSGAMPLWIADMLDRLKIYPCSFSKYGTAYIQMLKKSENKMIFFGGNNYVK